MRETIGQQDLHAWRQLRNIARQRVAHLDLQFKPQWGWQGGHMHEFRAGQRYFGKPDPEYRSMGMDPVEDERTVRLSEVLRKTGPKLIYTYDFGDSWEHEIVLEKQLPVDPIASYQVCTDGQLARPPDDCGGIPGFYDLVISLRPSLTQPRTAQRTERMIRL